MRERFHPLQGAARYGYLVAAWALLFLVIAQVYFAGAAVLASPGYWSVHVNVGHTISLPIVLMALLSLAGRMPRRFFLFCLALYGLYSLQYVFLHAPPAGMAMIRGLHAANALFIAGGAAIVARSAWRIVRE